MPPQVLAAVITGSCTLAAAMLGMFVARWLDYRQYESLSPERQKFLDGRWKGNVRQTIGLERTATDYPVILELKAKRKTVEGIGEFLREGTQEIEMKLELKGGLLYSQYLKMDYQSQNRATIQFGCMILFLSADGKTLEGRLVGYGSRAKKIVSASLSLEKVVLP